MNAQQMITLLERIEVDGSKPEDYRRVVHDERLVIAARLGRQDYAGAQLAVYEAQRVLDMWRSFV